MDKEELINELKDLRKERIDDLMKINAKHDMLVEFIANLNTLLTRQKRSLTHERFNN